MAKKHELTPGDIIPMADYAARRKEERKRIVEIKRRRQVAVGPFVTFHFESWETMWYQVQEMVLIEKGGAEQVPGELVAYNPLIPKGDELVATFMIEIDDPAQRQRELARLGGIERAVFMRVGQQEIRGQAEEDAERSTPDGKASSVQFVHFHFAPDAIAAFKTAGAKVTLGIDHAHYGHMAILPEPVRAELAQDFD
jgi:hypothetical protein